MAQGPIIEITDVNYCIKLRRDSFDLALVRQLIDRIQAAQFFTDFSDEDFNKREQSTFDENFDRLADK